MSFPVFSMGPVEKGQQSEKTPDWVVQLELYLPLKDVKARFYGSRGEAVQGLNSIMSVGHDGLPSNPSVMLFHPNKYVDEPVLIGGPTHLSGVVSYRKMLAERGVGDDAKQVMAESAVDLIVRPHRGDTIMCIRRSMLSPGDWPERVGKTYQLLVRLGMTPQKLMILDFSEELVSYALREGRMDRLFRTPKTLAERLQFIHDSRQHLQWGFDTKVKPPLVFWGLDGQRQMLSSSFEDFTGDMIGLSPLRSEAASALEHISTLARTRNNLDVPHLSFFGADPAKFSDKDVDQAAACLRGRADGSLDDQDAAALRALNEKFGSAVDEGKRTYCMDNESCREVLLNRLLGGFFQGISVPGLRSGYMGRIQWLQGPRVEAGIVGYPKTMDRTVADVCKELTRIFPNVEYMAPLRSLGSASIREAVEDRDRAVYFVVVKQKTDEHPFIVHLRRKSSEEADRTISAAEATSNFNINIPKFHKIMTSKGESFVARSYYVGTMPAERVPLEDFADGGLVVDMEDRLGRTAVKEAVAGRTAHFADGDDVLGMAPSGRYILSLLLEPTGMFQDVRTPLHESLGVYTAHLARSMMFSHVMGASEDDVKQVKDSFVNGFVGTLENVRHDIQYNRAHFQKNLDTPGTKNLLEKADEACDRALGTDVSKVRERLGAKTDETYSRLKEILAGVESDGARRELAVSLGQLLTTHPREIDQAFQVISGDGSFGGLNPREKTERVELLRLDMAAKNLGYDLKDIHAYALGLSKTHGDLGFAHFEDEVSGKFPGINFRGKEAMLISKAYAEPQLLVELRGRKYISS